MNVNSWINEQVDTPRDTRLLGALRIMTALFVFLHYGRRLALFIQYPDVFAMIMCIVFTVLIFAMMIGIFSRTAAILNGIIMIALYYDQNFKIFNLPATVESQGAWGYESALYFAGVLTLLIGMGPCGNSFSVDRLLFKLPRLAPTWNMPLIRFLVATVYFWTAFSKINPGFLTGEVLKQTFILYYTGSAAYHPPEFFVSSLAFLSKLVPLFELALGILLLYIPTRLLGVAIGTVFHLLLCLSMPVVGLSFGILVSYVAFLPGEKIFAEGET